MFLILKVNTEHNFRQIFFPKTPQSDLSPVSLDAWLGRMLMSRSVGVFPNFRCMFHPSLVSLSPTQTHPPLFWLRELAWARGRGGFTFQNKLLVHSNSGVMTSALTGKQLSLCCSLQLESQPATRQWKRVSWCASTFVLGSFWLKMSKRIVN